MSDRGIERESFVELVRQALGQIHSRSLLQAHPLCAFLSRQGASLTADDLQQALLDAIGQLRPAMVGPQPTSQWRRYRYLWLRYVEGVPLEQVAATLGVTDRQARRDHREALEAVAAVLWTRFCGTPWRPERPEDGQGKDGAAPPDEDEASAALDAELARLATDQPHGPTSLAETLQGALLTAARLIESRELRLDVSIPPDLPPVAMNRGILRQVLMSLLAHVARRPSPGRLRLEAAGDSKGVVVRISGLSAEHMAAPAGAAPSIGEETPLDLARRMAEREGGSLTVRPDGDGTEEILLRLPSAQVVTVLVVDDNLDFLRLCRRYLEGSIYRVLAVNLAAEALRLAREAQPDVILLDALMPTQDGWDLLATLKRDDETQHVPVVVCSVLREPSLALGLGAARFLPKPITLLSLLAALEEVVAERRGGRGSPAGTSSAPQPRGRPGE